MTDLILDSSVLAKWVLPEEGSAETKRLVEEHRASGGRVIVLDLALVEVTNAIWKSSRRGSISADQARELIRLLLELPIVTHEGMELTPRGYDIAAKYDRAVYDSLFVALARESKTIGLTADEPLYNAVRRDFPEITLLRTWNRQLEIPPGEKEPEE